MLSPGEHGQPPFGGDFGANFGRPANYPQGGIRGASTFDMSRGDGRQTGIFGGSATPGKQMFDEKIAQSTQMTYSDDDAKKAHWVKTLRNYLIGRCWEMR